MIDVYELKNIINGESEKCVKWVQKYIEKCVK